MGPPLQEVLERKFHLPPSRLRGFVNGEEKGKEKKERGNPLLSSPLPKSSAVDPRVDFLVTEETWSGLKKGEGEGKNWIFPASPPRAFKPGSSRSKI
jgi:hypothetical protein